MMRPHEEARADRPAQRHERLPPQLRDLVQHCPFRIEPVAARVFHGFAKKYPELAQFSS